MSADRVLTQTASQTTNLQQKIRAKRKTKRTLSRCVSGYRCDQDRKRPHVHKNAQRALFFFFTVSARTTNLIAEQKYLLHNTVQAFAPPIISVRDVVVV